MSLQLANRYDGHQLLNSIVRSRCIKAARVKGKIEVREDLVDLIKSRCRTSTFRFFKTVRVTLSDVVNLQSNTPWKVILLLRDPRSIIHSVNRYKFLPSLRNQTTICSNMIKNIQLAQRIGEHHILIVKYEDFENKMKQVARRVSVFLNEPSLQESILINAHIIQEMAIDHQHKTKEEEYFSILRSGNFMPPDGLNFQDDLCLTALDLYYKLPNIY